MPILTTMVMFGVGAVTGALSMRQKETKQRRRQSLKVLPSDTKSHRQSSLEVNDTEELPTEDNCEAMLAKSMPLAIAGTIGAVAAFVNPLFALPTAAITGFLTLPFLTAGIGIKY